MFVLFFSCAVASWWTSGAFASETNLRNHPKKRKRKKETELLTWIFELGLHLQSSLRLWGRCLCVDVCCCLSFCFFFCFFLSACSSVGLAGLFWNESSTTPSPIWVGQSEGRDVGVKSNQGLRRLSGHSGDGGQILHRWIESSPA